MHSGQHITIKSKRKALRAPIIRAVMCASPSQIRRYYESVSIQETTYDRPTWRRTNLRNLHSFDVHSTERYILPCRLCNILGNKLSIDSCLHWKSLREWATQCPRRHITIKSKRRPQAAPIIQGVMCFEASAIGREYTLFVARK